VRELVAAADTSLDIPLRKEAERFYGSGASVALDHGDYGPAFDCHKMAHFSESRDMAGATSRSTEDMR